MSVNDNNVLNQPNITFAMIKSDAVQNCVDKKIVDMILNEGFRVIHRHEDTHTNISMAQTVKFYYEHVGRPYFPDLMKSLIDGTVPMILELPGPNQYPAFLKLRELIGATNSRQAGPHTIRGRFGGHIYNPEAPVAQNAIHGSDSLISALAEIKIIFPGLTVLNTIDYGEFPLDHFRVGEGVKSPKIKILTTDYQEFTRLATAGKLPKQKLGRMFYDYFKLYESILKDDSSLVTLCNKDGQDALNLIDNLVVFI